MTEGDAAVGAVKETTVFPVAFRGLAGLPAEGQGRLSARRGAAFDAGGGARGGGIGGRHCALRPGEAFVPAAFSALRQRHALARSVGHHPRQARPGRVPTLFCGVDGGADERVGRGDRHRWQNSAAHLPGEGAEEPIHIVSAFAARQRMVLGQTRVGDKSNEIVAIPALLDLLAIEGAVLTIDAMGCQREIAQKIIDKKADYILALKGNQGTLRDDVELFAREQKAVAFKNTSVSQDTTVDGDHGRIETRTITVFHDIAWLQDNHRWPGLKSVVMVESKRETEGKVETETRFYITSLALLASALGPMIRSHWMVENGLHWVLDMIFRDDECRVRTDNAPFNLAIVKHIALNVLRTGKSKDSLRMRRKVAAWDENALATYIAA